MNLNRVLLTVNATRKSELYVVMNYVASLTSFRDSCMAAVLLWKLRLCSCVCLWPRLSSQVRFSVREYLVVA
jgi:hypothetical protein